MSVLDTILNPQTSFKAFSPEHAGVILFSIVIGAIIIWIGKRASSRTADYIGYGLGTFLSATVITSSLILISRGEFHQARDLPFAICNFSAYMAPVLMFSKSKRVYNIFYYWVIFGTLQAMITPDLHHGFPYFIFIKFWIVHCGLWIAILYLTIVKGNRPTYKGLWTSILVLLLFSIFLAGFNALFGTNHMYLCHKPPVASALDLLGPWPYYVLGGMAITIIGFHLVYLPFAWKRKP